jgi:tetratricopeptide (TPR) repeat protein
MLQDHPTSEDLDAFLRNASKPGRAARNARILRHLLASCPACRGRLEARGWSSSRLERLVYIPGQDQGVELVKPFYNYDRAFAHVEQVVEEFLTQAPPAPLPVEQLLQELDRLPRAAQLALAEEDERFAVPQLVQPLIDRSHAIRYEDPEMMLHWARIAQSIASRSAPEALGSQVRLADLRARAWGMYGNALRVCGQLHESESAMVTATRYMETGTGDPVLKARLYEQTASLQFFQRRFAEALLKLSEAEEIRRQLGDSHALAQTLVQESLIFIHTREAECAVVRLNQAIPLIDHEADPHLLLVACHNLMLCYIDLGEPEKALSIYSESQDLYNEFSDSLIQLRASWQEGQLLRDLGHLKAAETSLLRARQGFQERGLMYEVAVVCLDLAALYIKLKNIDDLKETVTATVPIFRALGVDREALASLLQLQQVADQEQQAVDLIRFLSARIEPLAKRGFLK